MVQVMWANVDALKGADLEGSTADVPDGSLEYWLGRARRTITSVAPEVVLGARIAAGTVEADAPSDVQIDLALSKLSNPGGIRTVQESNGPTSGSVTYGGDAPGQLVLSQEQRRALGVVAGSRRAAGTVPTWL